MFRMGHDADTRVFTFFKRTTRVHVLQILYQLQVKYKTFSVHSTYPFEQSLLGNEWPAEFRPWKSMEHEMLCPASKTLGSKPPSPKRFTSLFQQPQPIWAGGNGLAVCPVKVDVGVWNSCFFSRTQKLPSGIFAWRPCQIRLGRLASNKTTVIFKGLYVIYQRLQVLQAFLGVGFQFLSRLCCTASHFQMRKIRDG